MFRGSINSKRNRAPLHEKSGDAATTNGDESDRQDKPPRPGYLNSLPITLKLFVIRCMGLLRTYKKESKRAGLLILAIVYLKQVRDLRSGVGTNAIPTRISCPRIVGCYFTEERGQIERFERLARGGLKHHRSDRQIRVRSEDLENQKALLNSKRYKRKMRDPLFEGDCEPMRWWQQTSFPTCNKMHEIDMTDSRFRKIARGGYNDIFKLKDIDGTSYVMKILQGPYDTEWTDRNFDRVRRDSLVMERATKSPFVMDIYGFCGFAQVVDYGRDGNLDSVDFRRATQHQKLIYAAQAAQALADVHDIDGDGISAISHGDFALKQYIKVGSVYKLNDFNRGRFIRWNKRTQEPCTYMIGKNDGAVRAPEEYKYDPKTDMINFLTSKIDVWAFGSLVYEILTGHEVWHRESTRKAQQKIIDGELPAFPERIATSLDPIDAILKKVISFCYVYDAKDRPTAPEVAELLKNEAENFGVDISAK